MQQIYIWIVFVDLWRKETNDDAMVRLGPLNFNFCSVRVCASDSNPTLYAV